MGSEATGSMESWELMALRKVSMRRRCDRSSSSTWLSSDGAISWCPGAVSPVLYRCGQYPFGPRSTLLVSALLDRSALLANTLVDRSTLLVSTIWDHSSLLARASSTLRQASHCGRRKAKRESVARSASSTDSRSVVLSSADKSCFCAPHTLSQHRAHATSQCRTQGTDLGTSRPRVAAISVLHAASPYAGSVLHAGYGFGHLGAALAHALELERKPGDEVHEAPREIQRRAQHA
eukprot:3254801-Rhodomonas_salina.1